MQLRYATSLPSAHVEPQSAPVSMIWVRALLEAVVVEGVARSDFLAAAGLSPQQLVHPYAWIGGDEYDRLLALAVEQTGDAAFGLHWSQRSPLTKFDLFVILVSQAPTLRDGLECILTFQSILWKRAELTLVERPDSLIVQYEPRSTTELGARVRAELAIYSLLRLVRCIGASRGAVQSVAFAHSAPPYADEYMRVHPVEPLFDQPCCSLEVAASCLDQPLTSNQELFQVLKSQAYLVLARVERSAGYAGRVREYLGGVLPHVPNMVEAARALGLSVRSLRRRLAAEAWSYTRLLEDVQHATACQLLNDPTRSIKQVGFDVGFNTTTAFDRAFKRWTGASPSAFRSARVLQAVALESKAPSN